MKNRSLLALAAAVLCTGALTSSPALAASRPDLVVSISPPSGEHVYETALYNFTVANIGNKNASNVVLTIQLPETNTSPTVHVMGTLGTYDSRCTRSAAVLTCALGTILKFTGSTTVGVNIALPYSSAPLVFDASATTTTLPENNLANNSDSEVANPLPYDTEVIPPIYAVNRHCTGTNLTSFFECELYPSSISSFDSVFETDGTITVVGGPPDTYGEWTQVDTDNVLIEYFDTDGLIGTLNAFGVGGDCYEGPMNFPGSSYVAIYEVCLQ